MPSYAEMAAIIAALGSIGGVLVAWRSLSKKLDTTNVNIDGRLSQLIEAISEKEHALGVLQGRADEKSDNERKVP